LKKLIFVYTSAQFQVAGGYVKSFPHGKLFESTGNGGVSLAKGIYGVFPTMPGGKVTVTSTTGAQSTDFDTVEGDGKDIWGDPKLPTGAANGLTSSLYTTVRQAFSDLDDAGLNAFITGRSVV